MSDVAVVATLVGMTIVTVVTRSFFFLSKRPWPLPGWVERGLQYAPVAALAAVIAPETLTTDGHLIDTLCDARLYAALAGIAWYRWRKGVLGTIVFGMAVYLPLHVGLRW